MQIHAVDPNAKGVKNPNAQAVLIQGDSLDLTATLAVANQPFMDSSGSLVDEKHYQAHPVLPGGPAHPTNGCGGFDLALKFGVGAGYSCGHLFVSVGPSAALSLGVPGLSYSVQTSNPRSHVSGSCHAQGILGLGVGAGLKTDSPYAEQAYGELLVGMKAEFGCDVAFGIG